MNREEAQQIVAQQLSELLSNLLVTLDEKYVEAERMAIEELEQQPCEDVINRQAVLEQINCWIGSGEYKYTNATYYLTKRMQGLPSVTPQPKMGRWTHDGSHWENRWICSECGYKLFEEQTRFCPNCGAKMQEVEE